MSIPKRAFSVLFVNTFMSIVALDGCSTDDDCFHFQDLSSWNQEYLISICVDDGATDKSMNATLCAQFEDNLDYEKSLKLAILNQMYGKGKSSTLCPDWCMYDPLNVAGSTAVSFQWSNINACWMVNVGATSPLCNTGSYEEWEWAVSKTENWCCTPGPAKPTIMPTIMPSLVPTLLSLDPTQKPTSSPPPTLSGWPTIMPTPLPTLSPIDGMLCSTDNDCYQFQDLASWNQEYVTSLCNNYGNTDKSMSATLCNAYAGNLDYENSLKLAILNTMYGTGPIASRCPQWCMYDPYNIVGDTAVAFKWNNQQDCWIVSVGRNPLCHEQKVAEWAWAYSKTQNWCCPSDPTPEPTNSPLPLSESPTRSPTNDMLCSADDDCYQFTNLDSWNEEYVTSLCVNHGNTDKSTTATLCASWAGNIDYENSLKLAILNTMYGLGPSSSQCPYWCMYDPLNIVGLTAVGFKWKNSQSCWNVLIGASNSLCYGQAQREWEWAVLKSQNWCCASNPTVKPTISPPPTPRGQLTITPTASPTLSPINGMLCSAADDCYQFQDVDSWNQEYVTSLCSDDGFTDKSTNATLCGDYLGNVDYETSLKLAILNTMYGTAPSPLYSTCGYYCMYDPLNIEGEAAVGFKWSNSQSCWNVLVGASNRLCYVTSYEEWSWAISKSLNWCCPSQPTPAQN